MVSVAMRDVDVKLTTTIERSHRIQAIEDAVADVD